MAELSQKSNLLRVENLKVEFRTQSGVVSAVDGVSFAVEPGATVAIVGESGSGKSTVAQAIMGILPKVASITGGQILFNDPDHREGRSQSMQFPDGVDIAKLKPSGREMQCIRGGRISMIFQEPMTSLSPLHTIGNQISEANMLHCGTSKKEALEATTEMLRLVGFPDPEKAVHTYPFELSGGLRQRAMIAMALVCDPALLIADEPTTALDVTIQAQILKLISDLQYRLKMAVLIITHDLGVVANVADNVVVLYNGQVMESGPVQEIFEKPEHPYLKSLFRAVPHFDMKPGERLVPIREIKHTTGHLLAPKEDAVAGGQDDAPLLSVKNLSKSFTVRQEGLLGGGTTRIRAVQDVSFDIARGETLGLVGESGCGKTTVSKMIMRAVNPDGGQILFRDGGNVIDLTSLSQRELIPYRRKFQYVFQDPFGSLNPRMTVYDIISEPLMIHDIGDADYKREMVKELMNLVGLDPRFLNRYPHSFSGGQRQRISIARSLALKPELLLCDEPVSALDVSVQAQILNLMKDLQEELGLTYLFVSHNLAVVDYVADRIAVMCAGQMVELARREELFKNPVHPYTKALLAAVPFPDLDRRLDLTALMEGKASVPSLWPEPFAVKPGVNPVLVDIGNEHFVRVSGEASDLREAS